MGCKYVKEFEFGPAKTYVKGYARGGEAKPAAKPAAKSCGYAKGGKPVVEKETGEKYPSRKAMVKHEREETPRMQKEEVVRRSEIKIPARKMVPVASREPMVMKKGGPAKKRYADGGETQIPAALSAREQRIADRNAVQKAGRDDREAARNARRNDGVNQGAVNPQRPQGALSAVAQQPPMPQRPAMQPAMPPNVDYRPIPGMQPPMPQFGGMPGNPMDPYLAIMRQQMLGGVGTPDLAAYQEQLKQSMAQRQQMLQSMTPDQRLQFERNMQVQQAPQGQFGMNAATQQQLAAQQAGLAQNQYGMQQQGFGQFNPFQAGQIGQIGQQAAQQITQPPVQQAPLQNTQQAYMQNLAQQQGMNLPNAGAQQFRPMAQPQQPMAQQVRPMTMKRGGSVKPYNASPKISPAKVGKVMGEYKSGELHSGSAKGPVVQSRKQAVAIAMSEGRKAAKR